MAVSSSGSEQIAQNTSIANSNSVEDMPQARFCGRFFQALKKDPPLCSGIALSLFILSAILSLATVPGGMGVAGHLLGTTFMAQMTSTLTLGGVIAMAATGGTSALLALATLAWSAVESCIASRKAKQADRKTTLIF